MVERRSITTEETVGICSLGSGQGRGHCLCSLCAGSASSSRTSSQSSCPLHEAPPYEATAARKGEGQGEGKVGQSGKTTAEIHFSLVRGLTHTHTRATLVFKHGLLRKWCARTHARSDSHSHTPTHTARCPSGFSHSWRHPCCRCSDAAVTR